MPAIKFGPWSKYNVYASDISDEIQQEMYTCYMIAYYVKNQS